MKKVFITLSVVVILVYGAIYKFGYSNQYQEYDRTTRLIQQYGELSYEDTYDISGVYHLYDTTTIGANLTIVRSDAKTFEAQLLTTSIGGDVSVVQDILLYDGSRYLSGNEFNIVYNEDSTITLRFYGETGLGLYNGNYIKQITE